MIPFIYQHIEVKKGEKKNCVIHSVDFFLYLFIYFWLKKKKRVTDLTFENLF